MKHSIRFNARRRALVRALFVGTAIASVAPRTLIAADAVAAPELSGDVWINSPPLRMADLRGKVVLVEFWTFECWNCHNVEPYIKQWHTRYREQGLQVITVHAPEFERERDADNVRAYVDRAGIQYPVVLDNDFANWNRYRNRFWPTLYLIDKRGVIRHVKIGEGDYAATEQRIRALLAET
jgi:thiol-disulfide isomerase/thioredoxin